MNLREELEKKRKEVSKHLFICYSPALHHFLMKYHRIPFAVRGINPNSSCTFWVYVRNDELTRALTAYEEEVVNKR
jgi:hypothetical protein